MAVIDVVKGILVAGLEFVYDDGLIHRTVLTDDGRGGIITAGPIKVPCKVQLGEVTDYMRLEEGYTSKDVGLFVLQTEGLQLNPDDELEYDDQLYSLGALNEDPARAAWVVRGTPKNG